MALGDELADLVRPDLRAQLAAEAAGVERLDPPDRRAALADALPGRVYPKAQPG